MSLHAPLGGTDTLPRPTSRVPRPRVDPNRWRAILLRSVSPLLAAIAVVLWLIGFRPTVPSEIGSIGLITLLSPILLLAYPVLIAAVLVELVSSRPRQRLIACLTVLAVVGVYGLQPAIEQTARISVSWLHVGFARYIAEHGHVLLGYDARFSWPGFFSLLAMISGASGQADLTPLLQWTPVVLAGLATLGVRALACTVLGPGRRAWIATWIFLLTEWTEQDYFSPQGSTYVLLLGALGLVARFLVRPGLISPQPASIRDRLVPVGRVRDRVAAQAGVVLIALALAPAHQLTPYVLAALLMVMALTGRLWSAWLPWVVLLSAVAWFCLAAKDFWQGQLNMVLGDLGNVRSAVGQGIGERFVGDAGRTLILEARIGLTMLVALLAAVGWFVLRRNGMRSWTLPMLAIVPFGLIIVQSYGGEVFLRCYLFSLPFSAMLAAVGVSALLDRATAGKWLRARADAVGAFGVALRRGTALLAAVLVLSGLAFATITVRGGNDAYTSFGRADKAAVDYIYQRAMTNETVAALTSAVPLSYNRIGNIDQSTLESKCSDVTHLERCVLDRLPDYLIVTPSEENDGRIYDKLPPGWSQQVVRALIASGQYEVAFDKNGSQVLAVTTRELPVSARPQ